MSHTIVLSRMCKDLAFWKQIKYFQKLVIEVFIKESF